MNHLSLLLLLSLCMTGCMNLPSNETKEKEAAQKNIVYGKGQVYTMRGAGGIFSTGMNRFEATLENDHHIRTSRTIWYKSKALSDFIIKNYESGKLRGPIVLIGHSLGGNQQVQVAQNLNRAHVPIRLLITIDAVLPYRVPSNVQETFNIYKPGIVPLFSGLKLKAMNPDTTAIENFNVTSLKGIYVNHFIIDKHKGIQKIMLDKVVATLKSKPSTM